MPAKKNTYPNLRAEMTRHGETVGDLAAVLGISLQVTSQKLCKKSRWTQPQINLLLDHYGQTYEYLFAE